MPSRYGSRIHLSTNGKYTRSVNAVASNGMTRTESLMMALLSTMALRAATCRSKFALPCNRTLTTKPWS